MAKIILSKDGPSSYTAHGYTITRGMAPREDVPLEVVRYMQANSKHIRVKYDDVERTVVAAKVAEEVADDGKPKRPKLKAKVTEAIIEAIDKLDLDNETHFTQDGKPDARALTSILGWQVTKQDRDDALKVAAGDIVRPKNEDAPHVAPKNIKIVRKAAVPDELLDSGAEVTQGDGENTDASADEDGFEGGDDDFDTSVADAEGEEAEVEGGDPSKKGAITV